MKAFGLARLGRDGELRSTPSGEHVVNVSLAFDRRVKGEKTTDWVECTLWGRRAESLAPYLKKGGKVAVTLDDLHIESYEGKNGPSHRLKATVADIELADSKPQDAATPSTQDSAPAYKAPAPKVAPLRQAPAKQDSTIDDEIPF